MNEDFEAALNGLEKLSKEATNAPLTISPSAEDGKEGQPWTVQRLEQAIDAYYVEHERICLDPNARNLRHTYVLPSEDKRRCRVQQVLVDPEEHNDWVAEFELDLAQSRKSGEPVLRLVRIGSIGN